MSRSFALLMTFTTLWTLCYVLGLSSPSLEGKIFWLRVKYIPSTVTPIIWFYFSLHFAQSKQWFNNQKLRIFAVIYSITTLVIVFTSDFHGFMWKDVWIKPGFPEEEVIHGFYFWIYLAVSYIALLMTFFIYIKYYFHSAKIYKRQALTMVLGSVVPMFASITFLFLKLDLVPLLDETIFSFLISEILFSWSLFGFRSFELIPIAHDLVIQNMNIGLIVFDKNNRFLEINPLAQRLLKLKTDQVIGESANIIFKDQDEIFVMNDIRNEVEIEIIQRSDHENRYFNIHQSPIFDNKNGYSGRIMLITDISERKKNEIILSNYATIDELTRIFNRRHFFILAEKELTRAKRYKRQVSIIIFDIDSFKSFNDVYGHIMGDQVITHVAAKIKAAIRDSDIFGRFGGDEFICLFPEIAQDGAIKTVQRIQDILQKNVFVYEGESFPITMSFGISHWQGDQDITMETLIKHADFALLHAKKQGKNCYKLWEDISASEK